MLSSWNKDVIIIIIIIIASQINGMSETDFCKTKDSSETNQTIWRQYS